MKPEKMTDERLAEITLDYDMGSKSLWEKAPENTEALLAHITALTAERDDFRQKWKAEQAHCDAVRLDEQNARAELQRDLIEPLERTSRDLQRHHQEACRLLDEQRREVEALRERVQALEAERDGQGVAIAALEHRLAAIRQRAGDTIGLQTAWMRDKDSAAEYGAAHVVESGLHAVARYVLGEDSTGAEERICEHDVAPCTTCHPPATPTTPVVVAAARNAVGLPPLPTTAEDFATVRKNLRTDGYEDDGETMVALARIEARMGALVRLLRNIDWDDKGDVATLAAALGIDEEELEWLRDFTDAPPVFTLEEVEVALRAENVGEATRHFVQLRLSALRKG